MAKKLKDMTPFERVESRMKDLSVEEAEEVAIKILARVVAKKIYIRDAGSDYIIDLNKRIMKEADEFIKQNSVAFSVSRYFYQKKDNDI